MVLITINPGLPGAWTAILKEGANTIGRADDNDICLGEDGVSGHHCRVAVNAGGINITDLNSTNGTHVGGARIQEAAWVPGTTIFLGTIPVRLESVRDSVSTPQPPASPTPAVRVTPAIRVAAPRQVPTGDAAAAPVAAIAGQPASPSPGFRLRISGHAPTDVTPASSAPIAEPAQEAPPAELAPAPEPGFVVAPPGTTCRSHKKAQAVWTCPNCQKYFCDLCISTRVTSHGPAHLCRGCSVECTPVRVELAAETGERGFFARLPGAFLFPLRGIGIFVLILATVVFEGSGMMGGFYKYALKLMITGYVFVFMQDIIHGAAVGEEKMPGLPEFDGLFTAFFKLIGTCLISFILPIGLAVAKLSDVEIPTSAFVASILISLLYFPMAFLAVATLDSVAAANPIVIVPSILKVPAQYLVTVLIVCVIYGLRLVGDAFAQGANETAFTTTEGSVLFMVLGGRILWGLLSIYLLMVATRILGLLYVTQKEKLGWM